MDINAHSKTQDSQNPTATTPRLTTETPDSFAEKRGPSSPTRSNETASDTAADEDDIDVAEVATEHLEEMKEDLSQGKVKEAIVTSEGSESNSDNHLEDQAAESVVRAAIRRGVGDITVIAAEPNRAIEILGQDGKSHWFKLRGHEKSKIAWVEGKPHLLISTKLTEEEVKTETSSYFANEISRISNWYGLRDVFDPLFEYLDSTNFPESADVFGFYQIPRWQHERLRSFFEAEQVEDLKQEQLLKTADLESEALEGGPEK